MIAALFSALLLASQAILPQAVVKEDLQTFTLTSPSSGELTVSRTVTVLAEGGLSAAAFSLYCDGFESLQSFSGTVTPASGKTLKLKKADLDAIALSSSLVDDGISYSYTPSGHFPMEVHYTYKVLYRKGIASFPPFFPVDGPGVAVQKACYVVDVPSGYALDAISSRMAHSVTEEKKRQVHKWELSDFEAFAVEPMMPPVLEFVPYVQCSPQQINLGGWEGMQRNWTELGAWLYSLQEGTGELQDQEVARIRELTASCTGTLEKLRVLYAYLQQHTRYVSIQLGIGGLKPMAAREVSRTGFGDCKGLSNYLKALLAAVDVPSDYFVLSTSRASFPQGYASVGQMNHAMLAVPLPELNDTAWVECTNPSLPLGYRHEDVAGHQVVLVKEGGGEMLRVPAYPDSLSRIRQEADVVLSADGSARLRLRRELYLDEVEPYIDFRDLPRDNQVRRLTSGLSILPDSVQVTGIRDNFGAYEGRGYVPEMAIDYRFRTTSYANVSGNRLFVPLNPGAGLFPVQRSQRIHDLYHGGSRWKEDVIRLHLPEGCRVESLPQDVELESEWGTVRSEVSAAEEPGVLVIRQRVRLHPFRTPAARYAEYRDFARSANRLFSSTIVLVKD